MKWILPALLSVLAAVCYSAPGHSFLGLICLGLAAVVSCYYLLALWELRVLRNLLTACVCIGVLLVALTEIPILRAARGGEESPEVIIVLGAGLRGSQPSLILQSRIDRAYEYLTDNPEAVCIASGGQGPDEEISEAQCIYQHLVARGIDSRRILLEENSTSTWENFRFSLEILEEKGIKTEKIGVVSSEFHLFRAGIFARKCGIDPVGIPAETPWFTLKLNYFLREAAGIWHHLLIGE